MAEISQGMPQNEATGKEVRTRSRFPLSYTLYQTQRFGEITPHFVMETVPSDDVNLRSAHNVRSYTLGAPLLQNIDMRKDYFAVPMEAILPLNWEKFYTNPLSGDDVQPDEVGPTVAQFSKKICDCASAFKLGLHTVISDYGTNSYSNNARLGWLLRSLIVQEGFFSRGSLLSTLGYHIGSVVYWHNDAGQKVDFDHMFDLLCNSICKQITHFQVVFASRGSIEYVVCNENSSLIGSNSYSYYTFKEFLELAREEPSFYIDNITFDTGYTEFKLDVEGFTSIYQSMQIAISSAIPLNMSRLWAYQLVCAHYYSNDKIDSIYSADLYRQLIGYYVYNSNSGCYDNFTYNGINYQYDHLSAHYSNKFLTALSTVCAPQMTEPYLSPSLVGRLNWFSAVFQYRKSLRFYDYFSGSRTQPLAVGDVNVAVNGNNNVSVIDITKNIQLQRFLNSVNRTGRQLSEYVKGLFGVSQAPDYHNPFFIGHTNDTVFTAEVENTASEQYQKDISITSSFKSNGSRYAFGYKSDRDAILIGVSYFDIKRNYVDSIERQFLHIDRFDMFNPYMQFVGDQEIYQAEIKPRNITSLDSFPFGYTLRHMEYKQRYSQAVGGFANDALPGMCFIADADYDRRDDNPNHIDSDFIRSKNYELDRFYLSLTGFSQGTYFHFITVNNNDCEASRPMAFAPTIL